MLSMISLKNVNRNWSNKKLNKGKSFTKFRLKNCWQPKIPNMKDFKNKWLNFKTSKIWLKSKKSSKESFSKNSMNNRSKTNFKKRKTWNKRKLKKTKSSKKLGNLNFLKFSKKKRNRKSLENNFSKKTRMTLRSKCKKDRINVKQKSVDNSKRLKRPKQTCRMRRRNSNHMLRSAWSNGRATVKIFIR